MKRGWDSGQIVYSSLNHDFSFSAVPWKLSESGPGERVLSRLGGEQVTHLFLQLLQPQSGDAPSGCPQWGLGPSPHPLESIPGDLAGQGWGIEGS